MDQQEADDLKKEINTIRTENDLFSTKVIQLNRDLKGYLKLISSKEVYGLLTSDPDIAHEDSWGCTETLIERLISQVEAKVENLEQKIVDEKQNSEHLLSKYHHYKQQRWWVIKVRL